MPKEIDRKRLLKERYRAWQEGGSAWPVIEHLVSSGRETEAVTVARMALSVAACSERERIEAFLARIESVPAGWQAAIDRFAAEPSAEHWRAITRFAPEDSVYDWIRRAWRDLRKNGCDADALIRFATQSGITPDVMELVQSGAVAPETLLERGGERGAARSFWTGLAAEAAYMRGEKFRAVGLLREAVACATEMSVPIGSVYFLREQDDAEMEEMLRSAGLWEWSL